MNDLLSQPDRLQGMSEPGPLAVDLVRDNLETKRQFSSRLCAYDGDRATFSLIMVDALTRQGLTISELAAATDTAPTTVSRWAKGAAPSLLARKAAVERLKQAIDRRVADFERNFPSPVFSK